MNRIVLAAALVLAGTALGHAQDATAGLPPICSTGTAMDHGGHGAMGTPAGDEAHQALMAGMDEMNADMMAGAAAADIDVAFVCSMIPHHRGAISMAQAVLRYGDDEWARDLAEKIIAAQEQEIADMLAWLERQPD